MMNSIDMGKKRPKYMEGSSMFAASMRSVMQGLTWNSGKGGLKGGNFSQNGGEFLFVKKGGGNAIENWGTEFVHRMRNTRDHSEVDELGRVLGMSSAEAGHGITENKDAEQSSADGEEARQTREDDTERPPVKKRSSSLMRMARSWGRSRSNTNVSSSSGEAKAKGKEKEGYLKLDEGPTEVQATA